MAVECESTNDDDTLCNAVVHPHNTAPVASDDTMAVDDDTKALTRQLAESCLQLRWDGAEDVVIVSYPRRVDAGCRAADSRQSPETSRPTRDTSNKRKKKWRVCAAAADLIEFRPVDRVQCAQVDVSEDREEHLYQTALEERIELQAARHESMITSKRGLVKARHERRHKHEGARRQLRDKNLTTLRHRARGVTLRVDHRVARLAAGALARDEERRRVWRHQGRGRVCRGVTSTCEGSARPVNSNASGKRNKVVKHQLVADEPHLKGFDSEYANFLVSLQERDITPEDYDLLLQLDDGVSTAPPHAAPASVALVRGLQTGHYHREEAQAALLHLPYREITPEDYDLLLCLEGADLAGECPAVSEELRELPDIFECEETPRGASGEGGGDTCAVCMEPYSEGELRKFLPRCQHHFHVSCIDRWLLQHAATCPLDGLHVFDTDS